MKTKLLTIIFALAGVVVFADTSRLYTVRERLSSSTVNCITQDHYGFIWVGTENGLNRFDGYRFVNFLADATDSNTITDNEVTCFLIDKKYRLWVGSNKGLSRYSYETNDFRRYTFPNGVRPRVCSLRQDEDGNILIGTSGYGIYAICNGSDTVVHLSTFTKHRSDEFISRCFLDGNHHLWRFSHTSDVSRITFTSKNNGRPSPTAVKNYTLPCGPAVDLIIESGSSCLLVCMHGIMRYDNSTGEITDAGFDLSVLDHDVSICRAMRDCSGNIYVGTLGKGLMVIPKGQTKMVEYSATNLPFDLSSANVNDIFEDRNHNLWVGCYKKGLLQVSKSNKLYQTWSLAEQGYKLGSGVSSIAPGADGSVWCTVQKSGVYRFGADGRVLSRQPAPDGANVIYRDCHGGYWLGTETALYSYNPVNGSARCLLTFDGWGVNCLADDDDGTLFISNFSKGLTVYHQPTGTIQTYSMYQKSPTKGSLCNDWIKSLTVDSRGLLWIGTADGVSCMNPDDGNFRILGWESLLDGIQCYTICEQPDGNMLFGTNVGLYIYYRKEGKVALYPNTGSLRSKPIFNILYDANGVLWLSTVDGIWHKDNKKSDFIGGSGGSGLIRTEFTPRSAFLSADGRVVFGCTEGLVMFYPSKILSRSAQSGRVYMTGLTVNGKAVDPTLSSYVFTWDENSLTMEFSLLDYANPESVTYQYRLGGDSDWVSLPEGTNSLSLMRMKSGSYAVQVRAVVGGLASKDVLTVKVRIKVPWYASSMAYAIYGLLVLAMLALVFYLLDRYRQRQLEEEKMRFLLNLKKDVHSALKPINVKGNNKELLDRIMRSVNANLSNPDFNVEQLALDVGISRAQLHRKMKEMTGTSTSDFIRNLRLDQAAKLIAESKVNVTQVAYSVGFNNQSHFSTVFRKHYGMTPSEYALARRLDGELASGTSILTNNKSGLRSNE